MVTVGGQITKIESTQYPINLVDKAGKSVEFNVIGIEKISSPIVPTDLDAAAKILNVLPESINRPMTGEIDILIGIKYAAFHPERIKSIGHLTLYENRFGRTIAGFHPHIKETTKIDESCAVVKIAQVLHVTLVSKSFPETETLGTEPAKPVSCELQLPSSFLEREELGTSSSPKCGSCKCGNCHPGGKQMSLKEENEYNMIENNLQFVEKKGRWMANYPWIRNPSDLKNNCTVAFAVLRSTEKRLMSNSDHKEVYSKQISDMLERGAARKVTQEEIARYNGPKFYISHHAVMKPDSKSTPCRIVFNSSAKFMGLSLNDCLAKGPSLLNNLLGILMRFRENRFAFIGDIKKMFHSIDIPQSDQMMHLFLWRDCDLKSKPSTYAMTVVNMGDRPSATIAQIALRKSAEAAAEVYPESSELILKNSYMDDIPGSVRSDTELFQRMTEIEEILRTKGFKIKGWYHNAKKSADETQMSLPLITMSGVDKYTAEAVTEGVLGMMWNTQTDTLSFKEGKPCLIAPVSSKRTILSKMNSIYDPLGLLAPFTTQAKTIMRRAWSVEPKLGWDSPLPPDIKSEWQKVLSLFNDILKLSFPRPTCPFEATEPPILVIFLDASIHVYGAVAYLRWKSIDAYTSHLVMAKSRMAPLKTLDIVRLELSAGVISVRIRQTIETEMKQSVKKVVHLTDSEIVHAMVHRQSYGFNTYVGNRVGEIQTMSDPNEWAWISGSPDENIADIITRGCGPLELSSMSTWQQGPSFLSLPEEDWPVRFPVKETVIPEEHMKKSTKTNVVAATVQIDDDSSSGIDPTGCSRWQVLVMATARIIRLVKRYKKGSRSSDSEPTLEDHQEAELFWIKSAQKKINLDACKKLSPIVEDGVYRVGGRTERWMGCTWNQQKFILMPKKNHISTLIARDMHNKGGHLGIASSMSKVRLRFWIIGLKTLMKAIIRDCRKCKERLMSLQSQIMSTLPIERIKPAPPFACVAIDYFGPFVTRGEVQKRTRGKAYGVLFTCLVSRAVYVDIADDYSTDGFLQVLRRFSSLRGWPAMIYSDPGTQLVGASNELRRITQNLEWEEIKRYGYPHQTQWKFSPPDGQWFNGAAESMVKTIKRSITAAVGEAIMRFSELQTVVFESAGLVNERPIGNHPATPEESTYLTPNDLLLGRATRRAPQGPFKERCNYKHRHDYVQSVVSCFWKRWMNEVFPNMVMRPKWHTEHRNLEVGDVVLVQDSNAIRGQWKMALVEEVMASDDGKVRRVMIEYNTERGTRSRIERPVRKLILLAPAKEQ